MEFNFRTKKDCQFDAVSLGEVMLRFDPGEGRIRTARTFRVWEGGGEYNVARGLRRCFGMNTAIITAFADNEAGLLLEDLILQGGVDTSLIQWKKTDGIGRSCRNEDLGLILQNGALVSAVQKAAQTAQTPQSPKPLQKISILIIFSALLGHAGCTLEVFMPHFPSSPVKQSLPP